MAFTLNEVATSNGEGASKRFGFTVTEASENKLFLFGGSIACNFTNDFFCYDSTTLAREEVKPSGELPAPRDFHSAAFDSNKIIIFGGKRNGYLNDLHVYDVTSKTWTKLEPASERPVARYAHTAVVHQGVMYVYGGYDSSSFVCDELWSLDLKSWNWTKMKPQEPAATSTPASGSAFRALKRFVPLYHHSAVQYQGFIVLFGGMDDRYQEKNQLYVYSISQNMFYAVDVKGELPSPRYSHSVFVHHKRMYIVGGVSGKSEEAKDMYSIDLDEATNLSTGAPTWRKEQRFTEWGIVNAAVVAAAPEQATTSTKLLFFPGTASADSAIETPTPKKMAEESLANDILLHIFKFLAIREWCNLSICSKIWRVSVLASSNELWQPYVTRLFDREDYRFAVEKNPKLALSNVNQQDARGHKRHLATTLKWVMASSEGLKVGVPASFKVKKSPFTPIDQIQMPQSSVNSTVETVKVVVSGCKVTGKSCFIYRLGNDKFPEKPQYQYHHLLDFTNETSLKLDIADVYTYCGDIGRLWILSLSPETALILVTFSVMSRESLETVVNFWIPNTRAGCGSAPVILVGTMTDQRKNLQAMLEKRDGGAISKAAGEQVAKEMGCETYVECSAKTGEGFDDVKKAMAHALLASKSTNVTPAPTKPGGCILN